MTKCPKIGRLFYVYKLQKEVREKEVDNIPWAVDKKDAKVGPWSTTIAVHLKKDDTLKVIAIV